MAIMENHKDYREKIFELAKNRTNQIFYNSSAEHATTIHQALSKYAENEIDIFSSSMCSDVSNNKEYIDNLNSFLRSSKEHRINIIFTDLDEENFRNQDVCACLRKYPEQVAIRTTTSRVLYKGSEAHFTVVDSRAFRLETDIVNKMAYGNFNNTKKASDLKKVFYDLFANAQISNVLS